MTCLVSKPLHTARCVKAGWSPYVACALHAISCAQTNQVSLTVCIGAAVHSTSAEPTHKKKRAADDSQAARVSERGRLALRPMLVPSNTWDERAAAKLDRS